MKGFFFGALMLLFGLIGLIATFCGVLIGRGEAIYFVVPGVLFLIAAFFCGRTMVRAWSSKPAQPVAGAGDGEAD